MRQVVIKRCLAIALLAEAVDERADETEVVDATLKLLGRRIRVLQRQGCEGEEAVRPLGAFFSQDVIGAARNLDRLLLVGNSLHRRRIQRQDHGFDAMRIHQLQARILNVEQAMLQFLPVITGHEPGRILKCFRDCEMLFESDLALHVISSENRCSVAATCAVNIGPWVPGRACSGRSWCPRHPSSC